MQVGQLLDNPVSAHGPARARTAPKRLFTKHIHRGQQVMLHVAFRHRHFQFKRNPVTNVVFLLFGTTGPLGSRCLCAIFQVSRINFSTFPCRRSSLLAAESEAFVRVKVVARRSTRIQRTWAPSGAKAPGMAGKTM